MPETTMDLHRNGSNGLVSNKKDRESPRLWNKIQINERRFSISLTIISLSFVVGKLCTNYGNVLQHNDKYAVSAASVLPNLSDLNVTTLEAASKQFVSTSSQYKDVVTNVATLFYQRYGRMIRAAISGLIMMGFTWFIVYKDSSIPGVNPPFPFSPSKYRVPGTQRVQMNYMLGVLNGIIIFVYMCL